MDVLSARLWILFYLICFVAVLWATFLLVQGFMLYVSIGIVGIVIGFNLLLLLGEIRVHSRKKKEMNQFLKDQRDGEGHSKGGVR
jgi:hypothetical protein